MSPCFSAENFSYHRSSLDSRRLCPCTFKLNPSVKKKLLSATVSLELSSVVAPSTFVAAPSKSPSISLLLFYAFIPPCRGRKTWDVCPWSPSPGWQSWFSQHEGQGVDSSLVSPCLILVFSPFLYRCPCQESLGELGCSSLAL